jgi:hypothetical protein
LRAVMARAGEACAARKVVVAGQECRPTRYIKDSQDKLSPFPQRAPNSVASSGTPRPLRRTQEG